jgi:hypothetical protein
LTLQVHPLFSPLLSLSWEERNIHARQVKVDIIKGCCVCKRIGKGVSADVLTWLHLSICVEQHQHRVLLPTTMSYKEKKKRETERGRKTMSSYVHRFEEERSNFKAKAAVRSSIFRRLSSNCRRSMMMICVWKKKKRKTYTLKKRGRIDLVRSEHHRSFFASLCSSIWIYIFYL